MNRKRNVSMMVINRLPKYLRCVERLMKNDVKIVTSKELQLRTGFLDTKIRQDFNCFGSLGKQGYGYVVKEVYEKLSNILGISEKFTIIVVGAGNVGNALVNYSKFETNYGFTIGAVFDENPNLLDKHIDGIKIRNINSMKEYISNNKIIMAAICVPDCNAQSVCNSLVKYGIRGILNCTSTDINIPEGIIIENINLIDSLLMLTCLINEKNEKNNFLYSNRKINKIIENNQNQEIAVSLDEAES